MTVTQQRGAPAKVPIRFRNGELLSCATTQRLLHSKMKLGISFENESAGGKGTNRALER
jgi:hypothetical protein